MLLDLKFAILKEERHQYELASEIGMSETRLSRIILGRAQPTADERRSIARALNMSEDELFGEPSDEGGEK